MCIRDSSYSSRKSGVSLGRLPAGGCGKPVSKPIIMVAFSDACDATELRKSLRRGMRQVLCKRRSQLFFIVIDFPRRKRSRLSHRRHTRSRRLIEGVKPLLHSASPVSIAFEVDRCGQVPARQIQNSGPFPAKRPVIEGHSIATVHRIQESAEAFCRIAVVTGIALSLIHIWR